MFFYIQLIEELSNTYDFPVDQKSIDDALRRYSVSNE